MGEFLFPMVSFFILFSDRMVIDILWSSRYIEAEKTPHFFTKGEER